MRILMTDMKAHVQHPEYGDLIVTFMSSKAPIEDDLETYEKSIVVEPMIATEESMKKIDKMKVGEKREILASIGEMLQKKSNSYKVKPSEETLAAYNNRVEKFADFGKNEEE